MTGVDDGTCTVTLTLSKTGYSDLTHDYSVTINEGTLGDLTSPVYDAALRVGGAPVPLSTEPGGVPQGVTATWAYTTVGKRGSTVTSDICSIHAGNGTVTPGSAARIDDTCEITSTVTAIGYASKAAPVTTLNVRPGIIAVSNWGNYAPVTVGDPAADAPTLTGVTPTVGVSKMWESTTTSICRLDTSTGAVTGLDDGTCTITLTLSKTGYDSTERIYTITVQEGVMGALTEPVYDTNSKK